MSVNLRSSRNNLKPLLPPPFSPLIPTITILCPLHSLPITKISLPTKSLLCSTCQSLPSSSSLSLQQSRIHATSLFKSFIQQFKKTNQELLKTINMFKQPGVPEVKRLLKSSMGGVQQVIEKKLEEEIEKGNQRIGREVEKEFQGWGFLMMEGEGEVVISSLEEISMMMGYKEIFEGVRERVEGVKKEVKEGIIREVKKAVREYYDKNLII